MFYKDYSIINKDGYRSKCKECIKMVSKNRQPNQKIIINEKTCNICNKTKEIKHFLKSTRHKDGYMSCCKPCHYDKSNNIGCYPKIKRTPEYMKAYWKSKTNDIQYKMKKKYTTFITFIFKKNIK